MVERVKARRRANSRRSRMRLIASCTTIEAGERYQIQFSWNPGERVRITAGIPTRTIRVPELMSDGRVLPIAWNMLDETKISPDAANVSEMIRRYSVPTPITAGSFANTFTIASGAMLQ